jgi:hypothetical protein
VLVEFWDSAGCGRGRGARTPRAGVESAGAEIQTGVQHCNGPPFVYRGRAEHRSAGGPSSWHSLPCRRSLSRCQVRRQNATVFRLGVPTCVPYLITLDQMQPAEEVKAPRLRGFSRSPLTDSNRRPPPYHVLLVAAGHNWRQRFRLVLARSPPIRFATACYRLQPRGSIKAPSLRCNRATRAITLQQHRGWHSRVAAATPIPSLAPRMTLDTWIKLELFRHDDH